MSTFDSIPDTFYRCDQVRELDRRAVQNHGRTGIGLMKQAARDAFACARTLWPDCQSWIVLCGGGNNGGDGYIFAALAAQRAHKVTVFYSSDPQQLVNDAQTAWRYACQEGVAIEEFSPARATALQAADTVIVDALAGTGIRGPLRDAAARAVQWANGSGAPVLSLDLPSGLCGDTGTAAGEVVMATATIAFIGMKTGLLTGRGPRFCGQLFFSDLQVSADIYQDMEPEAIAPSRSDLRDQLPLRHADAHKGMFGHVMIIGGDHGYGGAALLASETAAVTGTGLTSLATRPEHVTAALIRRPEVMAVGVISGQELEPHLKRPGALVIGPGLGQTPWSEQMLQQALSIELPTVFDADALNILAQGRQVLPAPMDQHVFTPHPGEAARMLKCTTADIERDRFEAVRRLQQAYGGVFVLKGAGSLIYDGDTMVLARVGNPGLARGGSGDVLSGLIGGLLAQGLSAFAAAQLAVCLHGDAADLAVAETGTRGLLAAELIPWIRELLG